MIGSQQATPHAKSTQRTLNSHQSNKQDISKSADFSVKSQSHLNCISTVLGHEHIQIILSVIIDYFTKMLTCSNCVTQCDMTEVKRLEVFVILQSSVLI